MDGMLNYEQEGDRLIKQYLEGLYSFRILPVKDFIKTSLVIFKK